MSNKKKSQNKKGISTEKRAAKRAAVLGTDKKKGSPVLPILFGAVLLTAAVVYFMTSRSQESAPVPSPVSSKITATQVTYPVSHFDDGRAQHFQYAADDGITVKYFILKSSDGVIRAAFDACDVCWPAGKGYYQENDVMVCRNCGRKFASVLINEVKGGCNPAPLNRKIENGNVVIEIEDILAGKQYFDFSQRS